MLASVYKLSFCITQCTTFYTAKCLVHFHTKAAPITRTDGGLKHGKAIEESCCCLTG